MLPKRHRLAISLGIAVTAALVAFLYMSKDGQPGDYLYWWTAARAVLHGQSPYDVIPASDPQRFTTAFFYPLPTALVTVPFAFLPYALSGAVFVGLFSGLLAFGLLTTRGPWGLVTFLSPAFLVSAINGAWTLVVTAALFLPWLSALLVTKPNLAVPAFAYRPTRIAVVVGGALVLWSFALQPTWLSEWIAATRTLVGHPPPIASSAAIIALVLLWRWRRPETRLVLAMACVPQQAYMYDQLPLWAVAESKDDFLWLTLSSAIVYLFWLRLDVTGAGSWRAMEIVALSVHYLTVTAMIFGRANRNEHV